MWRAVRAAASGLLHATTGAGKTWRGVARGAGGTAVRQGAPRGAPPLTVLWLTPMRALAADTLSAR